MPGNTVNERLFREALRAFSANTSVVSLNGYADFDAFKSGLKLFHAAPGSPNYRSDTFPAIRCAIF